MLRESFDFDKKKSALGLAGKARKKWDNDVKRETEKEVVKEIAQDSVIEVLQDKIEVLTGIPVDSIVKTDNPKFTRWVIAWKYGDSPKQNFTTVTVSGSQMRCNIEIFIKNNSVALTFFKRSAQVKLRGEINLPINTEGIDVIIYQTKKLLGININESSTNLGLAKKAVSRFNGISDREKINRIFSFEDPAVAEWLEKKGIYSIDDCARVDRLKYVMTDRDIEGFFQGCEMIRFNEFKWFENLKMIPSLTFGYCRNLREIELPPVQLIEAAAFYECQHLREIVIPEGVQVIEQGAFDNDYLKKIWIPDTLERSEGIIGLLENSKDIKVYVKKTAKISLDLYGYSHEKVIWCDKDWRPIEGDVVKESVSNLGLGKRTVKKFNDTSKIDNVSVISFKDPEIARIMEEHGIVTFEDAAKAQQSDVELWFIENKRIRTFKEFKYFTSLKYVGYKMFQGCVSLEEITLPQSIEEIGEGSFMFTESLMELEIPDNVRVISTAAFYDSGISSVIFSPYSKLNTIGGNCFMRTRLTNINLPDNGNLKEIKYRAFTNLSLESLRIPASIEVFGDSDHDVFKGSSIDKDQIIIPENIDPKVKQDIYLCIKMKSE